MQVLQEKEHCLGGHPLAQAVIPFSSDDVTAEVPHQEGARGISENLKLNNKNAERFGNC